MKATVGLAKPGNEQLANFLEHANRIVLGKQNQFKLVLTALLADGHVLIEDVPGVGKTTLVKTMAQLLGLQTVRVQFTNDLLPADILGTSVYEEEEKHFVFHPGPIFGQIVIADELNRATPKTQSALLQAMEEKKVTVDGINYDLPAPFLVVATQNPAEQTGVYPLPESQLDRFLLRITMGYPDREAENRLLKGERRESILSQTQPLLNAKLLQDWQRLVEQVHVSDAIVEYLQNLIEYTRAKTQDMQGLSPRAGLAWLRAARGWAFIHSRSMVLPEDIQAVGVAVMAHRLPLAGITAAIAGEHLATQVLRAVNVD